VPAGRPVPAPEESSQKGDLPSATDNRVTRLPASSYTGGLGRSCLREDWPGADDQRGGTPAVIVVVRLRRRTEARSRLDEKLTVVIVPTLGVLIAPTASGHASLCSVGIAGGDS
jgi:hypothetical protein